MRKELKKTLEYKLKGFIDLTLDKRWELLEALFILGDFDQPNLLICNTLQLFL